MNKHTPGPWRVTEGNSQMRDDGTTIFHRGNFGVYSDAEKHGDAESDARLISAAPELFEALQSILAIRVRGLPLDPAWDAAESAISKAKGEK